MMSINMKNEEQVWEFVENKKEEFIKESIQLKNKPKK